MIRNVIKNHVFKTNTKNKFQNYFTLYVPKSSTTHARTASLLTGIVTLSIDFPNLGTSENNNTISTVTLFN